MELSWILLIVAGAVIFIQSIIIGYCVWKRCCSGDEKIDDSKSEEKTRTQPEPEREGNERNGATATTATARDGDRDRGIPREVGVADRDTDRLRRGVKSNPLDRVSKGTVPKIAFPPPAQQAKSFLPPPAPADKQIVVDQHPSSPPKMATDPKSGQLLESPHRVTVHSSPSATSSEESPIKSPSPESEVLSEPRSFFVVTSDQINEPDGVCVRLLPTAPLSRLLLHPKLKDVDLSGRALFITNYVSPDGCVTGKKKVLLTDTADSLGLAKSKMYREGIEQLITIEPDEQDEQLSLNLSTEIPEVVVAAQSPSDFGCDRHPDEESADRMESPNYSIRQPNAVKERNNSTNNNTNTNNNNTTVISIAQPHGSTTAKISTPVLTPAQPAHSGLSTPPASRYLIRQQHATSVDFVPVGDNSPDYDDDDGRHLPSYPPVGPLPWCPSEGSCFDVNNESHFTQYRHYCRIVNCPHATDPEHDVYFSHNLPPTGAMSQRDGYGYTTTNSNNNSHNYSFQSAHSFGRHM